MLILRSVEWYWGILSHSITAHQSGRTGGTRTVDNLSNQSIELKQNLIMIILYKQTRQG